MYHLYLTINVIKICQMLRQTLFIEDLEYLRVLLAAQLEFGLSGLKLDYALSHSSKREHVLFFPQLLCPKVITLYLSQNGGRFVKEKERTKEIRFLMIGGFSVYQSVNV